MLDKFSDGGFGQGINKIFQEGDMDGDYCKIFIFENSPFFACYFDK